LRILVVDDNEAAAEALALALGAGGHELRRAHDGMEALATARDFRPGAVFLDIGLRGVDGYEVARRLRAEPGFASVMLVAVTGYGQAEDRRRSEAAGFDHHVLKPVDPEVLLRLVGSIEG
jgi:CheY-like chemotaxis protein